METVVLKGLLCKKKNQKSVQSVVNIILVKSVWGVTVISMHITALMPRRHIRSSWLWLYWFLLSLLLSKTTKHSGHRLRIKNTTPTK